MAKVDYGKLKFSKLDKEIYSLTILDNPYIQHTPFPKQAAAIMYNSKQKLLGGNAFSGKSLVGYMLAAQWLMYPHYRCLLLRNTKEDVMATGGVVDYLTKYLLDEKYLGDNVCELKENKQMFIAPSGAKIFYNSMFSKKSRTKFNGRSYRQIIWDEAGNNYRENLSYISRSLRQPKDGIQIPQRLYFISNPSVNSGSDYLRENFVDPKGEYPYFELSFRDNLSIDADEYAQTLESLDPIDKASQLYGDWYFVPDSGMIIKRDEFKNQELQQDWLLDKQPDFNVIGVDLAASGEDKTALCSIVHFTDGSAAIMDSLQIKSKNTEEPIRQFLERNQERYHTNIIVFEKETGASPEYAQKYWYDILKDLLIEGNTHLTFYHPTDSKFERARPVAQSIRRKFMYINQELPDKRTLLNQFMYVHPDKDVMENYPSPDMLDATSLCFNHISMYFSLGAEKLTKSYNMGLM